ALAAGFEQHRVHRRLRLRTGREGLRPLRPADLDTGDLGAAGGDHRVVRHVLRLERRHRQPPPSQRPTQRGGHHGLARIGGRPRHQQSATTHSAMLSPDSGTHRPRPAAMIGSMTTSVYLAGEPEADRLLASEPLALLIGMLLDQQVPMETAFAGPKKIADRMDGLDVHRIAEAEPESFTQLCATPPAVHRFPSSMAGRIQQLCRIIVDDYSGRAEAIWTDGDPDGAEVLRRLKRLPGYGEQKARIFLALLGKQF